MSTGVDMTRATLSWCVLILPLLHKQWKRLRIPLGALERAIDFGKDNNTNKDTVIPWYLAYTGVPSTILAVPPRTIRLLLIHSVSRVAVLWTVWYLEERLGATVNGNDNGYGEVEVDDNAVHCHTGYSNYPLWSSSALILCWAMGGATRQIRHLLATWGARK